jgi:hypothetical protein
MTCNWSVVVGTVLHWFCCKPYEFLRHKFQRVYRNKRAPVLCFNFMAVLTHKIDAHVLVSLFILFQDSVFRYSSRQTDISASCASILNHHVCFNTQASCSVEMRQPNNSCPNTIGFQRRRDLQGRRVWALHYGAKFQMHVPTHVLRYISECASLEYRLEYGLCNVVTSTDF